MANNFYKILSVENELYLIEFKVPGFKISIFKDKIQQTKSFELNLFNSPPSFHSYGNYIICIMRISKTIYRISTKTWEISSIVLSKNFNGPCDGNYFIGFLNKNQITTALFDETVSNKPVMSRCVLYEMNFDSEISYKSRTLPFYSVSSIVSFNNMIIIRTMKIFIVLIKKF